MIRTAIRQPIRTGIRTAINSLGAAIRAVFNGADQYITIPTLTYTGTNFTKLFQWTYDSGDSGSKVFILGSGQGNTYGLYKSASDYITFSYVNTGATQTTITLSALTLVDGTKYTIQISSDGNGVSITAGGQSSSSSDVFDPSANTYTSMMADDAPGNYSAGSLKNAVMTDGSYIQNGDFLQGNGADLFIDTSVPVSAGDIISFYYKANNTGSDQRLLGTAQYNAPATHTSTNTLAYNSAAFPVVYVDDLAVASSGTKSLVNGRIYKITLDVGESLTITKIMSSHTLGGFQSGVTGGLTIESGSDTYIYNLNDIIDNGDGTGTAPNSGNTGSSYDGTVYNYDPGTDLTTVANNSRRYPINDKEATITDVVGGQDGTMQNHSADMWQ